MHFFVDPNNVDSILRICGKISDPKGYRPIYGYAKLEVFQEGVASLSVMDSYCEFTGNFEVGKVVDPGSAIIETDRLESIFKTRFGGSEVELKLEEEFLLLKQGEFRGRLPIFRREEFPQFDFVGDRSYSLELTPTLLFNLSRCADAVDIKGKDQFQGLLLDFTQKNQLWVCGFSNSLVHVHYTTVPEHGGFRCVLAPTCLPLLSHYTADVRTLLHFDLEHNKAIFSNPIMSMRVSFVEDKYPNGYIDFLGLQDMPRGKFYINKLAPDRSKVIESVPRKEIVFNTEEFLGAIKSATSVLGMEDKAVEFKRETRLPDGRGIAEFVGLNRMTQAKASEKILVQDDLDSKLVFGLHSEKVSSTVSKFQSETFKFHVFDSKSPIIITEEGVKDFVALSLPLRVS